MHFPHKAAIACASFALSLALASPLRAQKGARAARASAATQLSTRPAEVLQALSAHDVSKVSGLFANETPDDQRRLTALRSKLSQQVAELKASELQASPPQMDDAQGTVEFRIRLSWLTAVGREVSRVISFQARTQRHGPAWWLSPVKILSEVK